jgi:hypothetical protein
MTILINMQTRKSKIDERMFTAITWYEKEKFINGIKLNLFNIDEEK